MYRQHFGLKHHPFTSEVEPEDLFPATAAKELEIRLTHLLDMRGIGLVTGDSGSGKTTTCRHLVASLHSGLYRVLYVSMTTGNVMDLFKTISWEMGLPVERSRASLFRQIRTEVSRLVAEARVGATLHRLSFTAVANTPSTWSGPINVLGPVFFGAATLSSGAGAQDLRLTGSLNGSYTRGAAPCQARQR